MDETVLSSRAAAGDESAFEVLVRRHTDPLWRLARSLLRDDVEAEDAVQETFIKAYASLTSFGGRSSFRTWLHTICFRECMDRLRVQRANVVPLHTIAAPPSTETAPDTRLVVEQALRSMSSKEREAFVLVHVLGYSREEASIICGAPSSTVRSRVSRARLHLAAIIERTDAEEEAP
jgi:RNA polymerase sigma-70 factor, ECF subfamily